MDHYELRDRLGPETKTPVGGIPIASGCFMLMKADVARTAGGFGSTYFLYFEDFDLSLRLAQHGDIVYLPAMRIRHAGRRRRAQGLETSGHVWPVGMDLLSPLGMVLGIGPWSSQALFPQCRNPHSQSGPPRPSRAMLNKYWP